ncbi:hypothetical protein ABK040_004263 [Willaertia magna]
MSDNENSSTTQNNSSPTGMHQQQVNDNIVSVNNNNDVVGEMNKDENSNENTTSLQETISSMRRSSTRGRSIVKGTPPVLPPHLLNEITTTSTASNNESSENSSSSSPTNVSPLSSSPSSKTSDVINNEEALQKLVEARNRKKGRTYKTSARFEKQSEKVEENEWLTAGHCEFQGSRPTMEDALYCNLHYRSIDNKYNESFIGVFDGHGGSVASKQASEILYQVFLSKLSAYEEFLKLKESLLHEDVKTEQEQYNKKEELVILKARELIQRLNLHFKEKEQQQQKHSDEESPEEIELWNLSAIDVIPLLIREAFLETNDKVCETNSVDGTTASVVYLPFLYSQYLFVGNVGDSKVVLCRDGKPIVLTKDHRPTDPEERRRVRDAGKQIINNRISACLGVTRSIGDKTFHPGIISDPYTCYLQLSKEDEFIIIACDGVFDFVGEQEAINEIRDELDPIAASIKLRDYAYNKKGSNDNISVVVVRFKQDVTKQFWN